MMRPIRRLVCRWRGHDPFPAWPRNPDARPAYRRCWRCGDDIGPDGKPRR